MIKMPKEGKYNTTIHGLCKFKKYFGSRRMWKAKSRWILYFQISKIACRVGYKLVCVDDKFSKSIKSYLGEHAV